MTRHHDDAGCPHDHSRMLEDLRQLPSRDLGRLIAPLMPGLFNGEAAQHTRDAVRLVGQVLSERKSA